MAADRKLNSVSSVKDASFVYAETSSGETVKISKDDLASVVAEKIGLKDSGYTKIKGNSTINIPFTGGLFLFKSSYHNAYYSLYFATTGTCAKIAGSYNYIGESSSGFSASVAEGVLSVTNNGSVDKGVSIKCFSFEQL